jgi:hypothetical protein
LRLGRGAGEAGESDFFEAVLPYWAITPVEQDGVLISAKPSWFVVV